jgi:hypothetical protein
MSHETLSRCLSDQVKSEIQEYSFKPASAWARDMALVVEWLPSRRETLGSISRTGGKKKICLSNYTK